MKKLSLYVFLVLMILLTSCSEEKEDASLKNLQKQFENLKKFENDKSRLKSIEETIKEIKTIGSTFNDMDSSYKKFSYCDGFMRSQINLYKKKDSEKNFTFFLSCHFFTAFGTGSTFFCALLANFTVKLCTFISTGFT